MDVPKAKVQAVANCVATTTQPSSRQSKQNFTNAVINPSAAATSKITTISVLYSQSMSSLQTAKKTFFSYDPKLIRRFSHDHKLIRRFSHDHKLISS